MICAFGDTIANELKNMTPIFPLEAELGLTPKRESPSLPLGTPHADEISRVQAFVNRMDEVERTLPYVVLNYLRNTLVTQTWGIGSDESQKHSFLDKLLTDGVLEEYQVDNPKRPGRTTTAVRLNRSNEVVKQALGQKENRPP